MRSRSIVTALLIGISVLFNACSKDEDPPADKKALLAGSSSKVWITTYFSLAGLAPYADHPVCMQDDEWEFYVDGKIEQSEGGSKCDPDDPDLYATGTWSYNADTNTLAMTRSSLVNFSIDEITASTLTISNGSGVIKFKAK